MSPAFDVVMSFDFNITQPFYPGPINEFEAPQGTKIRKESHKEVERRRREVINTGISDLARMVPNCGDCGKGGIIQRAIQYIQHLKEAESRNAERWSMNKVLADQTIAELTAALEVYKAEVEQLRTQVTSLGGETPPRPQLPSITVPSYQPFPVHPYFSVPQWPQGYFSFEDKNDLSTE